MANMPTNEELRADLAIEHVEERRRIQRNKSAIDFCIYRVPKNLRSKNEEAFTPQLISIGPLHHNTESPSEMEAHKLRYQLDFRRRLGFDMEQLINLWGFIQRKEDSIRNSYRESTTRMNSRAFIKMILYDSIFIIEFFLRKHSLNRYQRDKAGIQPYKNDYLLFRPYSYTIIEDLVLLENQLPYFVLESVYDYSHLITNLPRESPPLPFSDLAVEILGETRPHRCVLENIKHFTDLLRKIRVSSVVNQPPVVKPRQVVNLQYTISKLNNARVSFVNVNDTFLADLSFENTALRIPHIRLTERSESLILNIMAYEQCRYTYSPKFCDYIYLLNALIDTEKDVELLVKNGIIENKLGDNAAVAKLVNGLSQGFVISRPSPYADMITGLNTHATSVLNKFLGRLKNTYFSDALTGGKTCFAILVVGFAATQTLYSIKGK